MCLAAAVESNSEHPLAEAVVRYAQSQNVDVAEAINFEAIAGSGVQGTVSDRLVQIGTQRWMSELGIQTNTLQSQKETWEADGKTVVLIAVDGELEGIMGIADPIKLSSPDAVRALRKLDLEVVMLTGDNQKNAEAIARQVGIVRVEAEVRPEQKAGKIKELQQEGKIVAMVGDGINDAPALAQADIGIAIGTGTDVAIAASDITLISGELQGIVTAIKLSKATINNIRQNLFFAFIYNVLGIPIAAGILFSFFGLLLNPIIAGGVGLRLEVIGGNNLSLVGGKIEFEGGKASTSQGIFGLEERNSTPPNQTNDIDASSEFGLSGEVEINILQVDPSQDSLNIPSAPVETEVAQICEPSDFGNQSEFIVTGRGGIPESPETSFNGDFGLEDWRVGEEDSLFSASSSNESLLRAEDENSEPIVEADSWIVNDQGKVVLVAHNTPNTSSELAQQSSNCQAK